MACVMTVLKDTCAVSTPLTRLFLHHRSRYHYLQHFVLPCLHVHIFSEKTQAAKGSPANWTRVSFCRKHNHHDWEGEWEGIHVSCILSCFLYPFMFLYLTISVPRSMFSKMQGLYITFLSIADCRKSRIQEALSVGSSWRIICDGVGRVARAQFYSPSEDLPLDICLRLRLAVHACCWCPEALFH